MAKRASTKITDQYTHPSAKRANLPTEQTGKTMSDTDRRPILYQPQTREVDDEPILAWNRQPANQEGHAAHPLYVREKVHPAAFVKLLQGGGEQSQLFADFNGLPAPDAAYEWYQHAANWSNRLIHGEAARVMASLLARENMSGKVQMIYFDPPYGVGYRSNFQVSVNNREVPEGAEGRPHDTRTIRAFRDTYERNIHSYLDLTREKLILMRELLADIGSIFMQIGDENVLRVGVLLDEVFGAENRVSLIPFSTTSGSSSKTLPSVADFLLWYAKDRELVKYRQLYESLDRAEIAKFMSSYVMVEFQDGTARAPTTEERSDPDGTLPQGARLYQRVALSSPGTSTTGRSAPYHWNDREWPCPSGDHWRVSLDGLDRLAELGRLDAAGRSSRLTWKRYENEVPGRRINNMWHRQMFSSDKRYVVQTADSVIERCILMSTDPGDLVFDPTCGGGTTAVAAEKWGRRWVTCDTSPVAVSIARQRLSTATFPYWTLADSADGARQEAKLSGKPEAAPPEDGWGNDPSEGFVYERVPQVSASVLAYDLDPDPIMLVDQPRKKRAVTRVTSPMTVESEQSWATVVPLEGSDDEMVVAHGDFSEAVGAALLNHTINGGRDNADMTIRALEPWPSDSELLAWKATYTINGGAAEHTAAVMVAAEDVTVPGEMVREAARETAESAERADVLLVVAYAYAADAPPKVGRITVARAQMNRDLMIRELSAETGHEAFVIIGEPDVRILDDYPNGQIAVEVQGYGTFDPATGNAAAGGPDDVACWMLDTDHDGESFYARRIHFPGADNDRQIKKLLKALGKNADDVEQEALTAMRSAPFNPPERGRIAVKIITATGMENDRYERDAEGIGVRLVWFKLRRFRRFEDARVNVDAPVIALVGPNEAGKSTLLDALVAVGTSGKFNPRDITRGLQLDERVLEATFLLDENDRAVLQDAVSEASNVRWYRVWRDASGELLRETVPPVPWTGKSATRLRSLLVKLRSLKWAATIDEELLGRIDKVISRIPDDESREYSQQELAEIEYLGTILADADSRNLPATLRKTCEAITRMIADEAKLRPQKTALELLSDRTPIVLSFTESDRTIHTSYNLQDRGSWTNGIHNLAILGGFDLVELSEASVGGRPEVREDILKRANKQLEELFSIKWSQSKLTVHLNVEGVMLEIFVASDNGSLHRWEDRSDGLRTYLALIAFLNSKDPSAPPVLVFDEAESHLHWDAQADLINVLYHQDMVSQVVYSTHSPGCLPHDLGHGVRAVIPTKPDRSKVENWIWATAAGFRPMLTHMGASSAALTPHRYAVATEGVADFILLPSLLREATGEDALPYQVVPGLAQLSGDGFRTIDSESDKMVYLTDGDDGGRGILSSLHRSGIPATRTFSLPTDVALEDLVSSETLAAAALEELRRSGHELYAPPVFPSTGRSSYLDGWCAEAGVKPPTKRAIACRVLELTARNPQAKRRWPLLEESHRTALSDLHRSFLDVFSAQ